MKRIFRWLGVNVSRGESVTDTTSDFESNEPDINISKKGVLLPDLHALENNDDTVPNLSIIRPNKADADESAGFDPYDTGVLKKD